MNKNTKNLRNRIKKACRLKQATVEHLKPVKDYHSCQSSTLFNKQIFPTAVPNKDGVVSQNLNRNSCMRVYRNYGEHKYQNTSLTVHESINGDKTTFQSKKKIESYERLSKRLTGTKPMVESKDGDTNTTYTASYVST